MAGAQKLLWAAVLLLISSGLLCSSSSPACPDSCTCQRPHLLNCSSSGLSSVPPHIQDSVTELDLSHNLLDSVTLLRPLRNLRSVRLGNNSITRLSLCIERNQGNRNVRGRRVHGLRPGSRWGCVSWAPALHLLSAERNQLEQLPEGLEGSESLQVLQLSFNRISTLQPEDLSHFQQLRELHLQHNLITSLHPQMFQELSQLRVLDLSFNMLTSLHPLTYFSLHNIGADVRLGGNRWQCDCSMRSLRRRMAYDSSRGLQVWSVVCASPPVLSGRDLLQLEEEDLNCFSTENRQELHQDVTVYSGSDILLSCSAQDSTWWTPQGQASVNHPQTGLRINDITERDTGLYVCVAEDHKALSVFNLQITKMGHAKRKPRSLPGTSQQIIPQVNPNRMRQGTNTTTQSNLALAVCLSVFITFLVAFILGVLTRPCIEVLWGRIFKKKTPAETNSVSPVEQRQYDNEAFSNSEEPEYVGAHRERRVTFSSVDIIEPSNVQYYDTVASGDQASTDDAVIECETAVRGKDSYTAGDSGSENSSRQSSPEVDRRDGRDLSGVRGEGRRHNIEFEHIPDAVVVEKRRSSSSSSDSSLSDKVINEDHTKPKSPQLAVDSVQQKADPSTARKVNMAQISEVDGEIPGFSSEPFADWSPHTNKADPAVWQESGEQFEFSDSVPSISPRSSSVSGSFNDSKLTVPPLSEKQRRNDTSSSSSYISDDETTEYTVNPDEDQCLNIQRPSPPEASSPSSSSESDAEIKDLKVGHSIGGAHKGITINQPKTSAARDTQYAPQIKSSLDIKRSLSSSDSSSSDDGMDERTKHSKKQKQRDVDMAVKDRKYVSHDAMRPQRSALDLSKVTPIKKPLDIRASSPTATDSSSSGESTDESIDQRKKLQDKQVTRIQFPDTRPVSYDPDTRWPAQDLEHSTTYNKFKGPLDIKTTSQAFESSSSSDSEYETPHHTKRPGKVDSEQLKFQKSQIEYHDQDTKRPNLDLNPIPGIKRHLDRKAPSPASESSSSSDSDDEMARQTKRPGKVDSVRLEFQKSQTESPDPDIRGPVLDLEHTTHIQRRPDIKATTPASESSSSSDSEDETIHIKKQGQGPMHMTRLPTKPSETPRHDPQTQWPTLDLNHIPDIKRRLDIKAPKPASESSSSSDSEDEMAPRTKRPGKVDSARLEFQKSQTDSPDRGTRQPVLDLEHTTHIQRNLDIKASTPASESSSSSDSEDEMSHIKKQEQGQMPMTKLPTKPSETSHHEPQTQWPAIDLNHIPGIKKRLDIKAPKPASESSSSSDSEDETSHIKKQEQGQMPMTKLPTQASKTPRHDPHTHWPTLDLNHIPGIKRRLDIKAPKPASESSSSSDSEDEMACQTKRPGKVDSAQLGSQKSQTESPDPGTRWPVLDLEQTTHVKRRLDIKAPKPDSESSSSSDSEDETSHIKKQEQGQMHMTKPPTKTSETPRHDPQTQWPTLDLNHIPGIKRRLDIKAPKPASESSSSSDSEDEISHIKKREQGQMHMTKPPTKPSETSHHDPQTQWPAIDLNHIPGIKKRLDIKAQKPASESSSSSDSEDEMAHQTKRPGKVDSAQLGFQKSQTDSPDPGTRWPVLDLEQTTHVQRNLDIKGPKPASESSSSSDSEDEMNHRKKQEQGQMPMTKLPTKPSETSHHEPQTQWPTLDLNHIPGIKRRLDIKAPKPDSESSSSSDSEDEIARQTKRPGKVDSAQLGFQKSQTESPDPSTRWPVLDLEQTTHVKRRLDIKAPKPDSVSSSSSDSEDETSHIKKQEQGQMHMTRPPTQGSETSHHEPQTQWPVLDLNYIPGIKRRLDIKAPKPVSESSSSSDSEDEMPNQTKQLGKVDISGLEFEKSQTERHDQDTRWPSLDLEQVPGIKKRLDIKAPSPASESSSSSDSEDEMAHQTKRPGKVDSAQLGFQKSQTDSPDPGTRWPVLDLEQTTHVKRRLDIKAPKPESESSSSSDSEDETSHIKKQEQGQINMTRPPTQGFETSHHEPQTQWPLLDLEHTTHIKRRLDIKAPKPVSESSSSSGSEDGTAHHPKQPGKVDISGLEFQKSQTENHDPDSRWPVLDLDHIPGTKRHLDIKAPPGSSSTRVSPGSKSKSSTSESEDENTDHTAISKTPEKDFIRFPRTPVLNIPLSPKTDGNIKLEKYTIVTDEMGDKTTGDNLSTTPKINPELESRWASMNLGISRFRKRLEITSQTNEPNLPSSPPPDSPSYFSGESGSDSNSSRRRQRRRRVPVQGNIHSEPPPTPENRPMGVSLSLKDRDDNSSHTVGVKERLRKHFSFPATEENANVDTTLVSFDTHHFRRYQDITNSEKAPATVPSQQISDSSSSSDTDDVSAEYAGKGWKGTSQVSVASDKETSQNRLSPLSSLRIKNEQETVGQRFPELRFEDLLIKKRLNVKAPSPEPSSSSSSSSASEDEVTKQTSNMPEMTETDSLITYKRVIIKASPPPSNYSPFSDKDQATDQMKQRHTGSDTLTAAQKGPYDRMGDRDASLASKPASGMTFHEVFKKRIEQTRHPTDAYIPPEIRWTGIGRQQSDLSNPSLRGHLTASLSSPQQAPPAEPEPTLLHFSSSSSSESDDNIKQDRGRADVPLLHIHSSPGVNSAALPSSRALGTFDNSFSSTAEILRDVSEDRRQMRGLSAIKAISNDRQQWDMTSDDQPQIQLHLSNTTVDRGDTDLLYGVPRYRKHNLGGINPPQEAPPPIPATPPPDKL